jgi:small subunit ribosomal protein S21
LLVWPPSIGSDRRKERPTGAAIHIERKILAAKDFMLLLRSKPVFLPRVMYPLKVHDFTRHGGIALAEVRLQEGEPLENALRRFKRKVQTEDIIKEVKRHSYYLKPGEKRRVKQALARKRAKKKIRKDRDSRPDRD